MTDYGDIDVDDIFDSDPVNDWLSIKERQNVTPLTIYELKCTLKSNSNETGLQQFLEQRETGILEASVQDLFDYADHLEERGSNDRGVSNKLSTASSFYSALMTMNQADSNPAGYVLEQLDLDTDPPDRDHHTVDEIANFLRFIPDPQVQTATLYSLKYGIRRGACANTDLHCVHLDHPKYLGFLDDQGIELHEAIEDKPDSIYMYSKFSEGDVIHGERRRDGNKRENEAILPIDEELKHSLLQFMTIRPKTSAPHPLFPALRRMNGEYERMSGDALYNLVIAKYATEYGIRNGSNREDVDFHYFRHFFSTQMSPLRGDHDGSLNDVIIKYIRGDKMNDEHQDILDEVYRHDSWGVNIRDEYLENIYNFGLFN